MQEVVAIANRYPPYGRGTVGMVQVFPNSRNVIPGRVKFSIDLRNVTDELLDIMHGEITAFVERTRAQETLDRNFTLSLDMLCVAGFYGVFRRMTPARERTLGYTIAELTSRPLR